MAETGTVIAANGEKVTVELLRTDACAKCRACSVGMKAETMVIECSNLCNAKLNDRVEIMLEESNFFKAVMIMYGIPLISFILGIGLGSIITNMLNMKNSEVTAFILGIIFVIISYLWIKSKESYWKNRGFTPKAVKIAESVPNRS